MSSLLYTPFPFNVTPASPLFELSPIASNLTQGWVPSCFTPECVPTASWSTASIGATLSFEFWGWDVTFDGSIKGNMSIELLRDGVKETWDPSAETLFSFRGKLTDDSYIHNVTLTLSMHFLVANSLSTRRGLTGLRVGASCENFDRQIWTIPSNDPRMIYSGFSEQASVAHAGSHITYMSSKAGDTVFMRFNASALLLYGSCGPTNGLMKVTLDGREFTVNTSIPIASNDCLLFQSRAAPSGVMREILIENTGDATIGINRFVFVSIYWVGPTSPSMVAQAVAIALVTVFVVVLIWAALMVSLKRSQGGKIREMFTSLCL
ncbi:hypothetical protein B0J17DRAFT_678491 [Rhizoctonia solani]|nr:hypothetical protein B0J17DRAFT_678491 [Rhizoctonia solani]